MTLDGFVCAAGYFILLFVVYLSFAVAVGKYLRSRQELCL